MSIDIKPSILDFLKEVYKDKNDIISLLFQSGTPNKLCFVNGKHFPVIAEKGGIFYVQTPLSGICQWINIELLDCYESIYKEMIIRNIESYHNHLIERSKNIRKPTCSHCHKSFETIMGLHKHKNKCKNKS